MTDIATTSYSTIFHCDQSFLVCALRGVEGIISLVMFLLFLQGYRVFSREQVTPLSASDKNVYMLAMAQTLLLALYYLLFQEFFMLATIRNLLIWIAINVLHHFCQIFWSKNEETLSLLSKVMNVLKLANFLLWFFVSLGDGSSLVNTDFNLGYNCKIMDWMILSGLLIIVVLCQLYVGVSLTDKISWEMEQFQKQGSELKLKDRVKQKSDVVLLMLSGSVGALVMFIWDYLAYTLSTTQASCVDLFSGNNFFRNVLCFLLKILTMQLNPSVIYYTFYHSRGIQPIAADNELQIDFLRDDAASDFDRTIASRRSSQKTESAVRREEQTSQYN